MLKINLKKKVKKNEKPKKFTGKGLKIVDEDSFAGGADLRPASEESDVDEADELPAIAAVVDERPMEVQVLESFNKGKWKRVEDEEEEDSDKGPPISSGANITSSRDGNGTRKRRDSDDISPPRQRARTSGSPPSPPARRRRRSSSSDVSPPRSSRKGRDPSPPRRSRHRNSSGDASPPRRRKGPRSPSPSRNHRRRRDSGDVSPPRRGDQNQRGHSPPRNRRLGDSGERSRSPRRAGNRRNSRDLSPPRQRQGQGRRRVSPDISPPRQRKRRDSGDVSPPRQRKRMGSDDASPPRRRRRSGSNDASPPRKRDMMTTSSRNPDGRRRDHRDRNVARPEVLDADDGKSKITLDGKKAGLQKATALRDEMLEFRKRENEMYELLPDEVSGRNAKAVKRDRRTEEDLAREAEKEKKESERKKQYDKWGKGLKQVEEQQERVQSALHEMAKPLARSKDDVDLDVHLKAIDREGDPMLEYLTAKRRKAKGVPEKPKYSGPPPPPNRFNIPPGYRWDGVDRSNGYEKEWFSRINAKKAIQEEAYKWSVEDL